ncbi:hypothetical protein C1H46_013587 [Malus baccata]|uniref:Peptidase M20 dimerisation domain-containing protein n=1 Tax=Malus baccata TaxID=106549 RepID=A0A540MPU6_MALBA|nr:hypothetical protein C1H46_013587 [Malus baccata]
MGHKFFGLLPGRIRWLQQYNLRPRPSRPNHTDGAAIEQRTDDESLQKSPTSGWSFSGLGFSVNTEKKEMCKIPSEIITPHSIIFSKTPEKITSLKFTHSAVLVLLLLLCSFTANSAHEYEDPTIKTMEDFSGYPINESHSTFHITLSSLSVDTQSLLMNFRLFPIHLPHQLPGPCILTRMYWRNFAILYRACISFLDAAGSAGYNKHEDDLLSVSIGIVTAIAASASIKVEFEGNGGHAGAVLMPNSLFLKKGCYSGFVELHIEQGPILEEEGVSIGIVTAIAASASIKVEFEGNGGHAGAVLMPNSNSIALETLSNCDLLSTSLPNHPLLSLFLKKGCYSGFVELHIEQGPILEEEGVSIGIVTAIAASASIKVEFEGNGGHAGAVLMPNR